MLFSKSEIKKIIREELYEALLEQDQQDPMAGAVEEPAVGPDTISDEEAAPLVVKTVRAYIGRFRQCYENRLKSSPELQGKWELFIDINVNGQVENPKISPVEGTSPDEVLEECLRGQILRMKIDTKGKTLANPMTGLGPIPLRFANPGLQEQEDQVDDEAVDVIEDFEELDPEAKAQTRAALSFGVGE